MSRLMIRLLILSIPTAMLLACSSGVKLDEVPVEDRTATPVAVVAGQPVPTPGAAGTPGTSAAARPAQVDPATRSGVAPVDLTKPAASTLNQPTANVIHFDYDSYVVKPEYASIVEGHAKYLKADRARKLAIEGHTDERGGREYNLALGQRRAEAVRQALGLLGVPDAQLEAVSFGKEKPVATGSSEDALARNRRAELTYR